MKKGISLLLTILLLLTMLPTAAFAAWDGTPTISVESFYNESSNTVSAKVKLGAYTGLQAISVRLKYDSSKLSCDISNVTLSGALESGSKNIVSATSEVAAAWDDTTPRNGSAGEVIMEVTFSVVDGKNGSCAFDITEYVTSDGDEETTTAPAGSNLISTAIIPAAPVAVTGVTLDKSSLNLTVGKTETLTATVNPDDATNKAVTWSSDKLSVATVSDTGLVAAVAEGTATITVTTVDGNKTATCAVTVTAKPAQTINAEDVIATYGDTDKSVSATASGAVSYAVKPGSEAYIEVNSATGALTIKKAGTATVTVTAAETADYAKTTKDVKVTISPKSITPEVTVNVPSGGYTYDGSAKTPGVTVKDGTTAIGADQYDVAYANNTNAGTAKVTVTAKTGSNYSWTTVEKPFSIAKAEQTIGGGNFPATVGSTVDLSTKFSAQGTLSYEITGANTTGSTIEGDSLKVGSTAGTFNLKVSAAATDNYNAAEKTVTVTVSAKETQVITAADVSAIYGDSGKKVSATTNGDGAISYAVKSGSEDYIDVAANGTLTIKKAGTAYVTVTAAETGTYAKATKDVKVTVAPKEINAPTADTKTYTYNGQNQTYGVTETADYTVSNGVQKNAGSHTVTVALKDKTNTVWADTNDTADKTFGFEIKKATITITAGNKTAYVGGTAPELGASDYTVAGLAEGESLKTAPTIAYESTPDMTKSGSVAIRVSGAEAPEGGNYNDIVYVDGTLTISTKSSGGSGGGVTTYAITVESAKNGSVTSDVKSAAKGTTITLTVEPDKGYTLETLTVTDGSGKEVKLTEKSGKYTFTMPASKVTVKAAFAAVVAEPENPFVDVADDAYYADAVLWAAEEGITGGTSATTFSPDAICTRAQAVTFLWRAAGSPAPKSSVNPFTDVAAGSYYYDAVLWAVENGITNGTSATAFSPNADCTRAQIVTFLWRAFAE